MSLSKPQLIIIGIVIAFFLILGLLFFISYSGNSNEPANPVQLTFWGVDNPEYFSSAISSWRAQNKKISVEYKQIDEKNYENTLLNAMATGKGPDVFMIHHNWLQKDGDKLYPASSDQMTVSQVQKLFPDVVEKDLTFNSRVYALPLYIDTLALFYNKDIFNNKGIALVPTTWDDFKAVVSRITEVDKTNNSLKLSAAAIGTSDNSIDKGSDLATLLMMQYGANISNKESNSINLSGESSAAALRFYLQFSDPANSYYTWNEDMGNSIDAFSSGNTAMIFNYASKISDITKKNQFLNFGIAPIPQYDTSAPVNYADYWAVGVSAQSINSPYAWQFIKFLTTDENASLSYLQSSQRPAALRTLIAQPVDPKLNAFASQTLTAKSLWGIDPKTYRSSISDVISSITSGKLDIVRALNTAASNINNQNQ